MITFTRERLAPRRPLIFVLGLALAITASAARAEAPPPDDTVTPEMRDRSAELDVPFVPSPDGVLDAMFDMAKPTRDDFVIDLGSGDGRIVIGAAYRYGARGFGVDLNADLVRIANNRARRAGVADRARFYVRNLFDTDVRQATVLTMYLLPDIVQELRPKLLAELRPGARIVSHDYHMGEWRPDNIRRVDIGRKDEDSVVYFWTVPANVAGAWEWTVRDDRLAKGESVAFEALIRQRYQDIEGTISLDMQTGRLLNATLSGNRIAFSTVGEIDERLVRHDFEGIIEGDTITGTVRLSGGIPTTTAPWSARRTRRAD